MEIAGVQREIQMENDAWVMSTRWWLNYKGNLHFYDPDQRSGKEIAMSVGWHGHIAWDIYLFYTPGIEWAEFPPKPVGWMHQVSDEWAKDEHYRTGEDLKCELTNSLKSLLIL